MAILGIYLNRNNPEFTKEDFLFWMPQFTKFLDTDDGDKYFQKIYKLVNNKIFEKIYGTDWELAMSLAIAHYLTIIGNQIQSPSGSSLATIAGGGVTKGVIQSATIGGFSKTYDLDRSMISSDDAIWWNQTSYGAQLMALAKTKAIPSIMVVTSNPVPFSNDTPPWKKPKDEI